MRITMSIWTGFVDYFSRHFRLNRSLLIAKHFPNFSDLLVCDLGGSVHFWEKMPLELLPKDLTILNTADDCQSGSHSGQLHELKLTIYDGKHIPFADAHFDVLICNSVIEHVPKAERTHFVEELKRVTKTYFVQTPAFIFPIEPHFVFPFLHWLPKRIARKLVPFGLWAILGRPSPERMESYFDEVNLLTLRELRAYFPEATIYQEKLLGMTKSHIAYLVDRQSEILSACKMKIG
jgi:SAM-dependent methyltransferase